MILVKVRKSKAYRLEHWFALDSIKIKDLDHDDGQYIYAFKGRT